MLARFRHRAIRWGSAAALLTTPSALLAQVDLGHPTIAPAFSNNIGSNVDRTVAFGAVSNFSLTSAGIRIDPLTVSSFTLRATRRAVTTGPVTRGAVLASATRNFTDTGLGFYDVPLAFNLLSASFYDIAFDITAGGTNGWGFNQYNMEYYDFDGPRGDPAYTVANTFCVLDGGCFGTGCNDYNNFFMPHVRLSGQPSTVVPEPSTYALLASGLARIAAVARRRRRA
jgi:hypothetical protein